MNCLLYIDPGTGSMLFSILISAVAALFFLAQRVILKIRFRISGGRAAVSSEKIPYLIFSDHKRYDSVFEPVMDEFEKRRVKAVFWTASADDPLLDKQYEYVETEFIGEGNKAYARLNLANAGILLSTTPGLNVYQWKRSKNVQWYVHMPHSVGDLTLYRMFGLDFYDAILMAGNFQKRKVRLLEKMRKEKPKELYEAGLTYFDSLDERVKKAGGVKKENGRFTVLLAPSWGVNSLFNRFGHRLIDALISTGYYLIIRPHPQSVTAEKDMLDELMMAYPESDHLEWNFDADNFEVLRRSDIMISDFSGVIYDFSLVFEKPVLYLESEFDTSKNDAAWIKDEIPWTVKSLPKVGIPIHEEDISNIKDLIDKAKVSRDLIRGRKQASDEDWTHKRKAAERVADYMIGKYEKLNMEK